MEHKDEFYIGYTDSMGNRTKRFLRKYLLFLITLVVLVSFAFSFFQKTAVNSSFDFDTLTQLSGTYYEAPYPMLRVNLAPNITKDIVLLGFGKYGANPYLDRIVKKGNLVNKKITIQGNLIYYNGKTLLQIDESYEVEIEPSGFSVPKARDMGEFTLEGEVVDPKCYFGVMKPGFGKIHRSCAARCISGGIPPVFVSYGENDIARHFLITDLKGKPINKDIIPYIGQPSVLKGTVEQQGDWFILKTDLNDVKKLDRISQIY